LANRLALTMVFALSFASYLAPDVMLSVQLVPLVLFAVIVIFKIFFSRGLLHALESLFAADSLLFVVFLSLLIVISSMQPKYDKSFAFSLVLSSFLILARLYTTMVPLSEIAEAFFWSGVISVAIFLPLVFGSLLESMRTLSRFSAFAFHPNLLGFVLGGYFCAMIWKLLTGGPAIRLISAFAGIVCLVIMFFASSRGSIAGVVAGCAVIAAISIVRPPKGGRRKLVKSLLISAALICAAVVWVQHLDWFKDGYDAAGAVLALTDPNRGVDSGLTGRVDKWQRTISALSDGSWLFGHGIRSSDMQDQLIDNSYLVMTYEVGIVPLILVVCRYAVVLHRFLRNYLSSVSSAEAMFYLSCLLFTLVFLTSNFFARFLLAVGNPCSLFAAFLFVSPLYSTGAIPIRASALGATAAV